MIKEQINKLEDLKSKIKPELKSTIQSKIDKLKEHKINKHGN